MNVHYYIFEADRAPEFNTYDDDKEAAARLGEIIDAEDKVEDIACDLRWLAFGHVKRYGDIRVVKLFTIPELASL